MRQMRGRGMEALIAFLLALALWSYVSFSTNPAVVAAHTAPLTATNVPAGMVLVDPDSAAPVSTTVPVSFRATGPRDLMAAAPTTSFRAWLDVRGLGAGSHVVPVRVSVPQGLHADTIAPSTVTIRLEPLEQRTLPITVKKRGLVPFVYEAGTVKQALSTATITGPAPLVRRVAVLQAALQLQNQTADVDTQVDVQPLDSAGLDVAGLTVIPPRVELTVPITLKVPSQQAAVVPNIVGSLPPGYVYGLDWDPKFVKVVAATGITGTVETEPITITGLTSNATRTVGLAAKQNVITEPPNSSITVRITINPIGVQQQLILALPIAPINIGDGLNALASPLAISVTLSGPFQQLATLSFKQLPATVDLRGRGPGIYHLPVTIAVPPGLQRIAPTKPEVTVILTARPTPVPVPAPTAPPTPPPPSATAGP